jgi:hypothetical protein
MTREASIEVRMTKEERETLERFAKAMGWTFLELEKFITQEFARKVASKKDMALHPYLS